jgi:hypothetical protein
MRNRSTKKHAPNRDKSTLTKCGWFVIPGSLAKTREDVTCKRCLALINPQSAHKQFMHQLLVRD